MFCLTIFKVYSLSSLQICIPKHGRQLHLWAFKISELPSAPLDLLAFLDAMNTHPMPFQVKFEPRIKVAELEAIMANYGRV